MGNRTREDVERVVYYAYQMATGVYPDRVDEMVCQDETTCQVVVDSVSEKFGISPPLTTSTKLSAYVDTLVDQLDIEE